MPEESKRHQKSMENARTFVLTGEGAHVLIYCLTRGCFVRGHCTAFAQCAVRCKSWDLSNLKGK